MSMVFVILWLAMAHIMWVVMISNTVASLRYITTLMNMESVLPWSQAINCTVYDTIRFINLS